MDILGTRVEVVLGDINRQEADARVLDFDQASADLKARNPGLKKGEIIHLSGEGETVPVLYARTNDLDKNADEEGIRLSVGKALLAAQSAGYSSLSFSPLGVPAGFSIIISAKIMAQEIYRYLRSEKKPSLLYIRCVISGQEQFVAFEKHMIKYLDHMVNTLARGPYLTVDGIVETGHGLVLIERKNPPFGWALPGGFVDYGESAEDAVKREVKEETGLEFRDISQFRVYSACGRDPRFHTVSVVFLGRGEGEPRAADDAVNAGIFSPENLPANMAFDHRQIIEDYQKTRV